MDELKIKSIFMRKIVSKAISMAVKKKLGYKVDIQLKDLEVNVIDGRTKLHVNADAEIDNSDFKNLVKSIGLED